MVNQHSTVTEMKHYITSSIDTKKVLCTKNSSNSEYVYEAYVSQFMNIDQIKSALIMLTETYNANIRKETAINDPNTKYYRISIDANLLIDNR